MPMMNREEDDYAAYHALTGIWLRAILDGQPGDTVDYFRIDSHIGLGGWKVYAIKWVDKSVRQFTPYGNDLLKENEMYLTYT